ncbi:hypothetical protein RP20_CCG019016 [Aedes albopictus]|nr:hypothetical protein RP20_CCG019016 [Aedes albopictus]
MTPIHHDSCSKPETTGTKQFRLSTNAASIQSSCNIKQQTNPPATLEQIIIKPLLEDGLLLYSGHHEYGDYISLCLNMGYVEFTFDLGSGPATVSSVKREQYGDRILRLGSIHPQSIYSRTLNG